MPAVKDLNLATTCDHCDKHVIAVHHGYTECPRCLPKEIVLRTCGACRDVRYCSTECQRQDWAHHKPNCKESQAIVELSESYGPLIAAQRRAILRWSKKHRVIIMPPAFWALGMGTDEDQSHTHCFFVFVEASTEYDPSHPEILPRVRYHSAKAVPLESIAKKFRHTWVSDRTDAPGIVPILQPTQPGCATLVVWEPFLPDGLGFLYMPIEAIDIVDHRHLFKNATVDWETWLRDSLVAGDNPDVAPYVHLDETEMLRNRAFHRWCRENGPTFGRAAFSALGVRSNAKQLTTHALKVYVDVKVSEDKNSPVFRFKIRSVATPTCDSDLVGLRTVVVDDGLPITDNFVNLMTGTLGIKNVRTMYRHRDDWLQHLKRLVDEF